MKQFVLTIAYEGTAYLGWQKTKMGPSIEGALERAMQQILQQRIRLSAASRTDAGVHAEGQVVHFEAATILSPNRLLMACNALLPPTIRVTRAEERAVNPSLDALSKRYRYRLSLGPVQLPEERLFAWHVPWRLDIETMGHCANALEGTRDFKSLCNRGEGRIYEHTVRTLYECTVAPWSHGLQITMEADRFLYRMARNIVGLLVYIGCGKISIEVLPALLRSGDRTQAGITAPPQGLCLMQVRYPSEDRENSPLNV